VTNTRKAKPLQYDLTGQTYGDFDILRFLGQQRWLLRCRHCQHEIERLSGDIRRGWARRTCPVCNAGNNVGLTRMEYKIALLVVQGLKNKEIAGQLVMSERTVQSHLYNISNKLNIANRTQLATCIKERQGGSMSNPIESKLVIQYLNEGEWKKLSEYNLTQVQEAYSALGQLVDAANGDVYRLVNIKVDLLATNQPPEGK
jgi:DNA-binding CsgD family transcriptional regulator